MVTSCKTSPYAVFKGKEPSPETVNFHKRTLARFNPRFFPLWEYLESRGVEVKDRL